MCSICGIIDFEGSGAVPELSDKMSEAMSKRGPDQSGSYCSKGVAFSHNRLAVIDVENGKQPMTRE
jgi:asparagine synthase (glutamine-hydrolysing)